MIWVPGVGIGSGTEIAYLVGVCSMSCIVLNKDENGSWMTKVRACLFHVCVDVVMGLCWLHRVDRVHWESTLREHRL